VLGAGDTFITSRITGVSGRYEFCGLLEGDYLVELDPVNMQVGARLNGMPTSTGNDLGNGTAPDPDDDVIDDDNGDDVAGFGIASKAITLSAGDEPPLGADGDDENGNQTLDFGVLCPLCLGDLVFKDLDDDGVYEPGDGETGIDGVRLRLYRDSDGSGDLSPGDELLALTTTADGGIYEFCGLANGSYIVEVVAINFTPGAPLEGHQSSIGNNVNGFAPDPDSDIDNDDNGDPRQDGGVASRAIDLGCGAEPDKPIDGDGMNGNRTLDFGFSCPADLCLGDLVFFDADDDGVFDPGDGEFGIPTVTLHLYRDDDASGDFSAGDTFVAETITDMFGAYGFCELSPGNYIVVIEPTNFNLGRILYNTESSRGNDILGMAPDPDDDVDDDDNGMGQLGGEVASKAITLQSKTEPDVGVDGDGTDGNQTLDLGLINILDPTAVEMSSLRVETGPDGQVTLRWSTASETSLAGFHVTRSRSFEGPYTRVSERLIPGGDQRDGASYRFVDQTDGQGTWFYRLEIIGVEGEVSIYGPVMADFRRPAAKAWRLWLPVLMR
jgi:hypothetical protein